MQHYILTEKGSLVDATNDPKQHIGRWLGHLVLQACSTIQSDMTDPGYTPPSLHEKSTKLAFESIN